MLKWLAIVAVFIALLFGRPCVSEQKQSSAHATKGTADQTQRPVPPLHVVIDPPLPAANSQPPAPAQPDTPKEKPLPRFARPEWVIVYVTVVYSILAWLTLRAIKRQGVTMEGQAKDAKESGKHTETLANQAVRQSDLTQRQLDLTNRPWICLDTLQAASSLEFKDDGCAIITFQYQIRNVGHSVAQHVLPWIEPILFYDHAKVRDRVSELLKKDTDSPYHHGMLIFPGQVIVKTLPVVIAPKTLAEALDKSPFIDNGAKIRGIGIELFVCFDYQSTLDHMHHQTQDMFLLSHNASGIFLPSKKVYPLAGFRLLPKGMGSYAD